MLNRFVKLPAVQNDFSSTQRVLDVNVPDYLGVISPKDCYLQVTCNVTNSNVNVVSNPQMTWDYGTDTGFHFDNQALVRRVQINTDKKGLVESQLRSDVVNNLKNVYGKSVEIDFLKNILMPIISLLLLIHTEIAYF